MEQSLAFKSPHKSRVLKELDAFISEWRAWEKEVAQIKDHPYDHMIQSGVYADGEDNMKKHHILQERTFAFLEKNIVGHRFMQDVNDGTKFDRTDLRLKIRVKHRIDELDELRARIPYANEQQGTTPAEQRAEVVTLKPGIWGISIDVREAYRRIRARCAGR